MLCPVFSFVDVLAENTLLGINYLEWIGYLASALVLISLIMSSIIKLRWINLAGASIFSLYGFLIAAYPVALMNLCITGADIYYLYDIYSEKETFDIWKVGDDKEYLRYFLNYHSKEIDKFFPSFGYEEKENTVELFLLRDMVPAGLVIAEKREDHSIFIHLDFATPEYRDFKLGRYFYQDRIEEFAEEGYERFLTISESEEHSKYLEKMGFSRQRKEGDGVYYERTIKD
ncbi:MAG: hypothetical protein ACOC55_06110 [Candidatus Natronoplasma sp.]